MSKIEYKVSRISSIKFFHEQIEQRELDKLFKAKEKGLAINLNIGSKTELSTSTMTIDITTKLSRQSDNQVLVEHTGRTAFEVKGLKNIYDKEKERINFPDGLLIQIYSIAYTHARALLAVELSPTVYKDKYFLPVVDPSVFLNMIKTA